MLFVWRHWWKIPHIHDDYWRPFELFKNHKNQLLFANHSTSKICLTVVKFIICWDIDFYGSRGNLPELKQLFWKKWELILSSITELFFFFNFHHGRSFRRPGATHSFYRYFFEEKVELEYCSRARWKERLQKSSDERS